MKRILLCLLVILIIGCSQSEPTKEQYTGIKISQPTPNEEGDLIHDIFNFDKETKTVNVTTICFDSNENVIDMSDSYIMELPPESVSGWKPSCPESTADYRINIDER